MEITEKEIVEDWRSVEGYDGYEVSNLGRVKSLDRLVNRNCGSVYFSKGRILNPGKDRCGYLQVVLWIDKKPKAFKVHRLVWEGFNGKIPEGMEVNHIDEDKSNNSIKNLNLMTHKENMNWGTAIERSSKKRSKSIIQFDRQGNFIAEFDSLSDASKQLNINKGNISSALKGRIKTAGGYIWKYKTA